MKNTIPLACLLSLIAFPSFADKDKPYEISAFAGYRFGGNFESRANGVHKEIKLEEASSYGLLFAWPYDKKRQTELLFTHYSSNLSDTSGIIPEDTNIKTGVAISYLQFGGNVPVSTGKNPVRVSGGLGLTHMKPNDSQLSNETRFSINIGLNKQFSITESLRFRLGSRLYGTFFNSDSSALCGPESCALYVSGNILAQAEVNAGLTYAF